MKELITGLLLGVVIMTFIFPRYDKIKRLPATIIIAGGDTVKIDNGNWDVTKSHASEGRMDTVNHIDTLWIGERKKRLTVNGMQFDSAGYLSIDTAYSLNDSILTLRKDSHIKYKKL